jgi:L-cystine uptake protein TcyP (sodium:dicarboxylate symporter family)
MKAVSLGCVVTFCAALLLPSTGFAVNCAQVLRYLQSGRTAEQVADTMIIGVDEVKKCQQEAEKKKAEEKKAEENKGEEK